MQVALFVSISIKLPSPMEINFSEQWQVPPALLTSITFGISTEAEIVSNFSLVLFSICSCHGVKRHIKNVTNSVLCWLPANWAIN